VEIQLVCQNIYIKYAHCISTSSDFDDLFNGGSPEDVVINLFMLWLVKVAL